jgi:murein DD-endopeptidase MepM/ murein hydrolase activator NlpD
MHFRTFICLSILVALAAPACARVGGEPAAAGRLSDVFLKPDTESLQGRVPRSATFDILFRSLRVREDLIPAVVSAVETVFDPRRLRTGQPYRLERALDGSLRGFEYEIDSDRFLRVATEPGREPPGLAAEIVPIEKQRTVTAVRGAISKETTSLFAAMDAAGERPDLSIALAEVFGGEIDFNTELQPGDQFGLAFEKLTRDGEFAGYGPILAAEFQNAGRAMRAFRFTPPGGQAGYYDEVGRSLRRFLLASPLRFEPRIISRFSRSRLHPILRTYRAHLGVDYVAPAGAPVVAVAAGVVTSAGFNGEAGRMVSIRHPNGYETLYMHLSAFAAGVRPGAHVDQGQQIGRVGSSGLSSGPHLDYRVKKNGVYVNPVLEHRRLPPGEPVPADCLAQFEAERDRALARLLSDGRALVPAAGDK